MKAARQEMPIEVEAQSLADVDAAIDAGADIILLDNLPLDEIHEAVARIAGRAKIEISGGVTLDRMPELARTGADYVSVGALTHSAPAVDLSFEIEPGCLTPLAAGPRRALARRRRAPRPLRRPGLLFSRNDVDQRRRGRARRARRARGHHGRCRGADGGARPPRAELVLAAGRRPVCLGRLSRGPSARRS